MTNNERRIAYNHIRKLRDRAKRAEWLAANPGYKKKNGPAPAPDGKARTIEKKRQRQRERAGVLRATGEVKQGECPICERDRPLVCDHDHVTGNIRGWICSDCNVGIGILGDRLEDLQRLVQYLETPT